MGHVVWRWKILSGEYLEPTLILLSGDFFFSPAKQPSVYSDNHTLYNELFLVSFAQLIALFQYKHKSIYLQTHFTSATHVK